MSTRHVPPLGQTKNIIGDELKWICRSVGRVSLHTVVATVARV